MAGVEQHLSDSAQPWHQRRIDPLGAPRIARRELRVQRGQDRPAIRLCVRTKRWCNVTTERPKSRDSSPAAHAQQTTGTLGSPDATTPLDDRDYQVPAPFTDKIDKVTIALDRPKLTPDDVKKFEAAERAAQYAN